MSSLMNRINSSKIAKSGVRSEQNRDAREFEAQRLANQVLEAEIAKKEAAMKGSMLSRRLAKARS